jgi:hypothetical protein
MVEGSKLWESLLKRLRDNGRSKRIALNRDMRMV